MQQSWRSAAVGVALLLVALLAPLPSPNAPALAQEAPGCEVAVDMASRVTEVVVDAEGRTLVASADGIVRRYLDDGRLDAGFGLRGEVAFDGSALGGYAYRVDGLLVHGGRILLAGEVSVEDAATFEVVRTPGVVALRTDGALDTAYGVAGFSALPQLRGGFPSAGLGQGGQVIVAALTTESDAEGAVVRLTADGSVDRSFADGFATFSSEEGWPAAVAIRATGQTVVLLDGPSSDDAPGGLRLAQLTSDGRRDTTFGAGGGVAAVPALTGSFSAELVAAPDGDVLLLGPSLRGDGAPESVLQRVGLEGFDPAFGGAGQAAAVRRFAGSAGLAVDAGGRSLIAHGDEDEAVLLLTRVLPDGGVDEAYGDGGTLRHRSRATDGANRRVVARADGGATVALSSALVRVTPDGTVACADGGGGGGGSFVTRLSGTDRFGTAAAVSAHAFPSGASTVFVATGGQFPDALAGTPAAARAQAPILLVTGTSVPAPTAAELRRLAPSRIVVLGGRAAVSDEVLAQLRGYAANVERIAGPDRFATAASISAATFPDGADEVLLATGQAFPDALAGGVAAGALGRPILLVTRDTIPAATLAELDRLRPRQVTLLGGEQAISFAVIEQVAARYGDAYPIRIAGSSRFGTAAAIADLLRDPSVEDVPTVYLATGGNFPDALAAGAAAVREGGPLLLVPTGELLEVVRSQLAALTPGRVVVLGGGAAVSDAVLAALETPGMLTHTFTNLRSEREPVRWNPCEPIAWVLNTAGGPEGSLSTIREAIDRLAAASGLTFRYDGLVDEPARRSDTGYGYQPQRYGERPAPLLVAFGDLSDTPFAGYGEYLLVRDGFRRDGGQAISGFVVLSDAKAWSTGFDAGDDSLGPVVLHELVHAVGLGHTSSRDELMFPFTSGLDDLGPGDRLGLRSVGTRYGCLQPAADLLDRDKG